MMQSTQVLSGVNPTNINWFCVVMFNWYRSKLTQKPNHFPTDWHGTAFLGNIHCPDTEWNDVKIICVVCSQGMHARFLRSPCTLCPPSMSTGIRVEPCAVMQLMHSDL